MTFYFFASVATYAIHGWRENTDEQFRDSIPGTHAYMLTLILAEITEWLVLVAG